MRKPALHILTIATLALLAPRPVSADDKDLLKKTGAPPNVMIVFGNSQTTERPMAGTASMWDGDGDSPSSKLGASKRVIKQFVQQRRGSLNMGLTAFAHNSTGQPNPMIYRKHWVYAPLTDDFPHESWKEPAGTIERWGTYGDGPCAQIGSGAPACASVNGKYALYPSATKFGTRDSSTTASVFFGNVHDSGTAPPAIYLDSKTRILIQITTGDYGDAYVDGTLTSYKRTCANPFTGSSLACSVVVTKRYQTYSNSTGTWAAPASGKTPGGDNPTVSVPYAPAPTLIAPDQFYTTGDDVGDQIGFLRDDSRNADWGVSANCSGWEFQSNANPQPLIKIPRDYQWGAACDQPPQDSYPCVARLLRPQAVITRYDKESGAFTDYSSTQYDHDNPGYIGSSQTCNGPGCNADGCQPSLRGAADMTDDGAWNNAIVAIQNGSQAPIKNLLSNIWDYFSNSSIDGFTNGKRADDPNAVCRTSSVILIYDNFNGCQNDNCSYLNSFVLQNFAKAKIPIYVIGLGVSGSDDSNAGYCIANHTGASFIDEATGNTHVGYFTVNDAAGLYKALNKIADKITEAGKDFASASISSVQAGGDQMAFLATFNATKFRSIWDGRINGYLLNPDGSLPSGTYTITDPNDPNANQTIPVPSNDPHVLIWNAGENLAITPGTGATDSSAVLSPTHTLAHGTYTDFSTVDPGSQTIQTSYYPGRKVIFSLPYSVSVPTTLPLANSAVVPEVRYDMVLPAGTYSGADTSSITWWQVLKRLMSPQTAPPNVGAPIADPDQSDAIRFIWGDRDAVMGAAVTGAYLYNKRKLGDIFHSNPAIVGGPANYFYYASNLNGYSQFFDSYKHRRRVLFAGANDGLLHAFDVGVYKRGYSGTISFNPCQPLSNGTTPDCYDLGTGTELFAYAPRSIMQIYKPLKDAQDSQTKKTEWTVDGSPSAADVFIDPNHGGTPANRSWQTVVVGGMREGSPFEGTSGSYPQSSTGSYYALDVTQPDEMVTESGVTTISPGSFAPPKCLNASGDATCARNWPTVLWEFQDYGDADLQGAGATYPDMGETWSKPGIGRLRICTSGCGTSTATYEDRYVAVFGGGFDRERKNRRGNWLYLVDIETGQVVLRANSSCGVASASGTCTMFGAIPSEPSVIDFNGDGYIDAVYIADNLGQLWRVDLTDLRLLSSATGRFANKIDFNAGSPKPFLLFRAPTGTVSNQYYMAFFRPSVIFLSDNTTGAPTVGIAFGTGDRDDIVASLDPISATYQQRFYYVIDDRSNVTRTEADLKMFDSTSTTTITAADAPKGWGMTLAKGERVITDTLTIEGVISFGTYVPPQAGNPGSKCGSPVVCNDPGGKSRYYSVDYATGNPVGATRGSDVLNAPGSVAQFITNPVLYTSANQGTHVIFTTSSGTVAPQTVKKNTSTAVKEWKER